MQAPEHSERCSISGHLHAQALQPVCSLLQPALLLKCLGHLRMHSSCKSNRSARSLTVRQHNGAFHVARSNVERVEWSSKALGCS